MTEEEQQEESELTPEELAQQDADAIPDRVAMVLIDMNVAIPIDPAVAADVLAGEPVAEGESPEGGEAEEERGGGHG
jgi:hypothetical protein